MVNNETREKLCRRLGGEGQGGYLKVRARVAQRQTGVAVRRPRNFLAAGLAQAKCSNYLPTAKCLSILSLCTLA